MPGASKPLKRRQLQTKEITLGVQKIYMKTSNTKIHDILERAGPMRSTRLIT